VPSGQDPANYEHRRAEENLPQVVAIGGDSHPGRRRDLRLGDGQADDRQGIQDADQRQRTHTIGQVLGIDQQSPERARKSWGQVLQYDTHGYLLPL
jgi:hypothetical protein